METPSLFSSVDRVLETLRAGRPVIVSDAAHRENEGDAIMSATLATQQWIAWMVRHTSGYLCAPMPAPLADKFALPLMVAENEDPRRTAYAVSVDAATGITTGISAHDRARTLNLLGDPNATAASFIRPGHILPVRAVDGGVRQRPGHTEAAVELMRAAGLPPVGVIGEMISPDGSTMRMNDLLATGVREGVPVTTIEHLIAWLDERDNPTRSRPERPAVALHRTPQLATRTVQLLDRPTERMDST